VIKRVVATYLWFQLTWTAGAVLADMVGVPGVISLALALVVGAVVWTDPTHALWTQRDPARAGRRPVQIEDRAEPRGEATTRPA
jgi:hypothetical protein